MSSDKLKVIKKTVRLSPDMRDDVEDLGIEIYSGDIDNYEFVFGIAKQNGTPLLLTEQEKVKLWIVPSGGTHPYWKDVKIDKTLNAIVFGFNKDEFTAEGTVGFNIILVSEGMQTDVGDFSFEYKKSWYSQYDIESTDNTSQLVDKEAEYLEKEANLLSQISRLQSELEAKNAEILNIRSQMENESVSNKESLSNKIAELESQLAYKVAQATDLSDNINNLNTTISSLNEEKELLTSQLNAQKEAVGILTESNNQLIEKVGTLTESNKQKDETISNLEKIRDSLSTKPQERFGLIGKLHLNVYDVLTDINTNHKYFINNKGFFVGKEGVEYPDEAYLFEEPLINIGDRSWEIENTYRMMIQILTKSDAKYVIGEYIDGEFHKLFKEERDFGDGSDVYLNNHFLNLYDIKIKMLSGSLKDLEINVYENYIGDVFLYNDSLNNIGFSISAPITLTKDIMTVTDGDESENDGELFVTKHFSISVTHIPYIMQLAEKYKEQYKYLVLVLSGPNDVDSVNLYDPFNNSTTIMGDGKTLYEKTSAMPIPIVIDSSKNIPSELTFDMSFRSEIDNTPFISTMFIQLFGVPTPRPLM